MAKSKRPRKLPSESAARLADITVTWDITKPQWVFLDDGFAIPRTFIVRADFSNEPLSVSITVEIEAKRARSREVRVSTDRPGGVSSTTLRGVPIRDLVAQGCKETLHAVESNTGTKFALAMPGHYGPAEVEAVKRLVGYVEVEP